MAARGPAARIVLHVSPGWSCIADSEASPTRATEPHASRPRPAFERCPMSSSVLAANIEERIEAAHARLRRPVLLFFTLAFAAVILFAGMGPISVAVQGNTRVYVQPNVRPGAAIVPASALADRRKMSAAAGTLPSTAAAKPPPPPPHRAAATCGDGKCEPPETVETCFADCPGVTTPAMCGEEPHSDPQGTAVVDGRGHKKKSAAECCAACDAHARKYPKRPCNSWVFCYMPQCWSLDTGNKHTFGECWLKWQTDAKHPLYGQRGRYSADFQKRHYWAHRHNNLTVPTHVAWAGGVMGARVDLSVTWETGADGSMRSSAGDTIVDYRPWESREQNLKRGVKPEQMKF